MNDLTQKWRLREKLPDSHLGGALAAFEPGAGPLMMLEGTQLGSRTCFRPANNGVVVPDPWLFS